MKCSPQEREQYAAAWNRSRYVYDRVDIINSGASRAVQHAFREIAQALTIVHLEPL